MVEKKLFFEIFLILFFVILFPLQNSFPQNNRNNTGILVKNNLSKSKYDIAAFYWPDYHYEPRLKFIFPGKKGEWETVWNAKPKGKGEYQPRVPLWGYQNEADPKVMDEKIKEAVLHDVNVFIFDWYWFNDKPLLEDCLNNGFLKANHNRMKFYIMWANHNATSYWNYKDAKKDSVYWTGKVNMNVFKNIVNRIIKNYFSKPSYYKINGKPVFAIYQLDNLINGLGGPEATKRALKYFEKKTVEAGFPGLHLQSILWSAVPNSIKIANDVLVKGQNKVLDYFGFDSFTNYTWAHLVKPEGDYDKWADASTYIWKTYSKKFNIPYFPQVSIDWDNNPRYPASVKTPYITNSGPEKFKKYLIKAKGYLDEHPDQPKLITINAWNEWTEGSYLEPDKKFGYGYLDAIKQVFEPAK